MPVNWPEGEYTINMRTAIFVNRSSVNPQTPKLKIHIRDAQGGGGAQKISDERGLWQACRDQTGRKERVRANICIQGCTV